MARRPDLIVPIRDRRQRKRYLTLKNFAVVAFIVAVAFAAITIRSEMTGTDGSGSFGRLVQGEIPAPVDTQPVEVVQEASSAVPDSTHADPTLVAPMVREQWLHDAEKPELVPVDTTTAGRAVASVTAGTTHVAIVGGSDGVAIVQQRDRKPVLSGGFGKPPV